VSKKREERYESCFTPLFPLSNSIREGELKWVSKNPASLTQSSTNYRWWLFTLLNLRSNYLTGFTLLNKDKFNRVNIKPLRGLAEILFLLITPFSLSFSQREGRCVLFYLLLFPLSNSVREGELKGVSKKREGRYGSCFIPLFPLSNSIREGE
jgi:hypothetical protein